MRNKQYIFSIKRTLAILLFVFFSLSAQAQFADSMTGLLLMPSADFDQSGTFKITNNFHHEKYLPDHKSYDWDKENAFGYGFSITFWSRLEIAYVCTMMDSYVRGTVHMINQDRHFAAKVLALKEGEIWTWTPSIALGLSDPVTGALSGQYIGSDVSQGNGFFNRYYVVTKKTFYTIIGQIGVHLGYQYTQRKDFLASGPIAAIDWSPVWLRNRWFDPKFVIEYDAKTPNIGFVADIWDNRFEAMFCLQNFQWISFGLRYKLRINGSK